MKEKTKRGYANLIGRRVEEIRKSQMLTQKEFVVRLQLAGLNISPSSYASLESQTRPARDIEVFVISRVLNVPMEEMFSIGA